MVERPRHDNRGVLVCFARGLLGDSPPAAVMVAVGATRDPLSSPSLRNGTLPGGDFCIHSPWEYLRVAMLSMVVQQSYGKPPERRAQIGGRPHESTIRGKRDAAICILRGIPIFLLATL